MPLLRDTPRDELGPYLRQHADNPVDWHPWGDEAAAEARARDRPILLSVGYSSCHWCHVMAHESFEDPAVAEVMNRLFVNVKVDREERPDVDAVYMHAVQALSGSGGWPMTVFLTPDGAPFFGGTYFPRADRHGLIGFPRLLERVDEAWRDHRDDLVEQGQRLEAAIARAAAFGGDEGELSASVLADARAAFATEFDPRFGGFGRAPKFPPSSTLEFLLRAHVRGRDEDAMAMATVTLDAMAAGGMCDQVGGGFHRYSVDPYWLVPHFEKMLYDQALLLGAYTRGWLVTRDAQYRRVVEGIVEYVRRDLRHPDGGFFAAEDADSEGIEGKFYLWSLDELTEVCGPDSPEVVRYFGVTAEGNFEDPHTGYRGNILHVVDRTEAPPAAVTRALPRLLAARAERVRPSLDDQVLLGWNALFLRALAEAAAALDRPDWLEDATATARFLLDTMRRSDGRLLHQRPAGPVTVLAYADDYAALLEALVSLAEIDDVAWLDDARATADDLLARFADPDGGGFFTTGSDAEALIVRPKDLQDGATPAASSLATHGLLRLAALTGEAAYDEAARSWLRAMAPVLAQHPSAVAYLLAGLERALAPPLEVALIGAGDALAALRREVFGRLLPDAVTLSAPAGVGGDRSPLLAERQPPDGAAAYVCERYACQAPVATPDELRAALDRALAG